MNYRCLHVCLGLILVGFITCDCSFPFSNLKNDEILYESPTDIHRKIFSENYMLRFKCSVGYMMIGPSSIICIGNKWSKFPPVCLKMRCFKDPPNIENGTYELSSDIGRIPQIGSTATYRCNDGYELLNSNESVLSCVFDEKEDTGMWRGETPICKEKTSCPDPGVSNNGERRGSCCFSGDVLQFSCNEGYALVGTPQTVCLSTGNWNSRRPLCRPPEVHCELPPPIPYGVAKGSQDGDYYLPYDEVEILCEPGYSYKGPAQYVMCEEDGVWDEGFGECSEIFCDPPETLANGTIPELLSTNLTSFPFNFEITYICNKGFRLIEGDSWRLCDVRGWSGKTPNCEAIQCPDPGVPAYGSRQGDSFDVGSKVLFKCFTGYYLLGSFERYCKPNGQWSGELTRCDTETNFCPDPGIPINGFKNGASYEEGKRIGFACRPGYILVGPEIIECLKNRTWSRKVPKCLGPYDFDSNAQVKDFLKTDIIQKAEKQNDALEKHRKSVSLGFTNNFLPEMLEFGFSGRIIFYFVFDVSGSVGPENFQKSIAFAKAIVKKVGITKSAVRVGALTFSSKAEIIFYPSQFTTTEDVLDAFDRIKYTGGGTSTTSALTLIKKEAIPSTEKWLKHDKGLKTVVFLLTDGRANMGGDPTEEAESLKEDGVTIYCIGITGSVRRDALYKIASGSKEEPYVFILENYSTLSWLVQEITNGTIDYSQCGVGLEDVGTQVYKDRIIGGTKAIKPWPWMAALYFLPHGTVDPRNAKLKCGGSIIHKNFILTAAHCLHAKENLKRNAREVFVKLGLTDVKNESGIQEPEVKTFFIHPQYRQGARFDYDIALLQLIQPLEFTAQVRPICLPPAELPEASTFYASDQFGIATGWGHEGVVFQGIDVQTKSADRLKELILPIQTRERCKKSLEGRRVNVHAFTDRMFCVGDGLGNDTCVGDSGGPLMQSQLNEEGYLYWTQVGIVSWGIGCGLPDTYGFYTHVQELRRWIDETIEIASEEII